MGFSALSCQLSVSQFPVSSARHRSTGYWRLATGYWLLVSSLLPLTGHYVSPRRRPGRSRRSCTRRRPRAGKRRPGRTRRCFAIPPSGIVAIDLAFASSTVTPLLLGVDLVKVPDAIGVDAARDDLVDPDPDAASSIARVFASAGTDARSTVDSPRFGIGSLTDEEVDIRIAPPPRACHRRHRRAHHAQRAEQQQVRRILPRGIVERDRQTGRGAHPSWSSARRCRRNVSRGCLDPSLNAHRPIERRRHGQHLRSRSRARSAPPRLVIAASSRDEIETRAPLTRQRARDRVTESFARPGNQRHFVFQLKIHLRISAGCGRYLPQGKCSPVLGSYSNRSTPSSVGGAGCCRSFRRDPHGMAGASQRLAPLHDPIESLARRLVQRRGRRPRGRAARARPGGGALPSGSPCRCLPGTRSASAARRGKTCRPPRSISPGTEQRDDCDEDLGKSKAGHRAGRASEQFLEQEHTAKPAEDPHR